MKNKLFILLAFVLFAFNANAQIAGTSGVIKATSKANLDAVTPTPAQGEAVVGMITDGAVTSNLYLWDVPTSTWIEVSSPLITKDSTEIALLWDETNGLRAHLQPQGAIANQYLKYNGTGWIPASITASEVTLVDAPSDWNATNIEDLAAEIADTVLSLKADLIADSMTITGTLNKITVTRNSRNNFTIDAGVLAITDVSVDAASSDIAAFVTASYTGTEFQEGDVAIITIDGTAWIHNGGVAGTVADFTQIEAPQLTDAAIRALFSSANTGIDYNATTGVFTMTVAASSPVTATYVAGGVELSAAAQINDSLDTNIRPDIVALNDSIDAHRVELDAITTTTVTDGTGFDLTTTADNISFVYDYPELIQVTAPESGVDRILLYDNSGATHGYVTPAQLGYANGTFASDAASSATVNVGEFYILSAVNVYGGVAGTPRMRLF